MIDSSRHFNNKIKLIAVYIEIQTNFCVSLTQLQIDC